MSKNRIRFSRLDTIGAADAEHDNLFKESFIDTGFVDVIKDNDDPRNIILGRTGSGKSAIIRYLSDNEKRVIVISPENLALSYITNSNILNYLMSIGVRFDLFFKLLWRHVLSIEIIKTHSHITNEESAQNWLFSIFQGNSSKKTKETIDYLKKWGSGFWKETDYRVKEITDNFTGKLEANIGSKFIGTKSGITIESQQKSEFIEHAQRAVDDIQISELSNMINLLDQVLDDDQKKYYILIDKLDENWIEDHLRYQMIKSLIEASKDFKTVKNLKVIIALRDDLLQQVYEKTKDRGFQKEKYESLCLHISWQKEDLQRLLEKRVNTLLKNKKQIESNIKIDSILPKSIDKHTAPLDYILDRTLLRPRDAISYFNYIIKRADRQTSITAQIIKSAESEYSHSRFNALSDEWFADYPNFMKATKLLKSRKASFNISDITIDQVDDFCLELQTADLDVSYKIGHLYSLSRDYVNGIINIKTLRDNIIIIFYELGIIGLKLNHNDSVIYYHDESRNIQSPILNTYTKIIIHKAFWRALSIEQRT